MKKIFIFLAIVSFFFTSCNKEVVVLEGKVKGVFDTQMIVKIISKSGKKEQILDTIDINNKGGFEFETEKIKPPVKLTFTLLNNKTFQVWAGEYGVKTLEVDKKDLNDVKVLGSFFCDELQRMNTNLNKMYIEPVKEKELEVAKLNELAKLEGLSDEDDIRLARLKKDIKKAYLCRKKSILKTVRKASQNPVAVALMCQEYERLTSHQKKECLKYLSRTFGDTGLNWQMKN